MGFILKFVTILSVLQRFYIKIYIIFFSQADVSSILSKSTEVNVGIYIKKKQII